jgi:hypothetical protein
MTTVHIFGNMVKRRRSVKKTGIPRLGVRIKT